MNLDIDKPLQVVIKNSEGKRRTQQNSLYWLWMQYLGGLLGQTAHEIHLENKLLLGVDILSRSDPEFATVWKRFGGGMDFRTQLKIIDLLDVTKLFTVAQFTEYLNEIKSRYDEAGYPLPLPEDLWYTGLAGRFA